MKKKPKSTRFLSFLLLLMLLTGCKDILYGDLDEQQANEMLATLLDHCIDAKKVPGKKGRVILTVDEGQMNTAVNALKRNGFPKEIKKMDIMEDSPMVPSPTEVKAKHVLIISQELMHTLAKLDGVVDARAHIVLAEEDKLGRPIVPASVGIMIKHVSGINMKRHVSKIKAMVQHGVPGVEIENISVALIEAVHTAKDISYSLCDQDSEDENDSSKSGFWSFWLLLALSAIIVIVNILLFVLWWQSKEKKKLKNFTAKQK